MMAKGGGPASRLLGKFRRKGGVGPAPLFARRGRGSGSLESDGPLEREEEEEEEEEDGFGLSEFDRGAAAATRAAKPAASLALKAAVDSGKKSRVTHHRRTRARDRLAKLLLLRRAASQQTLAATAASTAAADPNPSVAPTAASTCAADDGEDAARRGHRNDGLPAERREREFQIFEGERVLCDASSSERGAPGRGRRRLARDGRSIARRLRGRLEAWVLDAPATQEGGQAAASSTASSLLLADGFLVLLLLRVMPQLYLVAVLHLAVVASASILRKVLRRLYLSSSPSAVQRRLVEQQQQQQAPSPKRFTFRRGSGSSPAVSFPPSMREQPRYRPASSPSPSSSDLVLLEAQASSDVSQLTCPDESEEDEEERGEGGGGAGPAAARAATAAASSGSRASDRPPQTPPRSEAAEDPSSSSLSSSPPPSPSSPASSSSSSPYDAKMAQQIRYMISQLTDEEQELAARTNYTYFTTQDPALREAAVSHMCARYLRSKKVPDTALLKMKETLAFRKEMNVDHLRLALRGDNAAKCETAQKLRSHVEHKAVYVQGFDRDGRSTFIFEPHRVVEYCHDISLKHHVWTLERAIACSRHPDRTINAVINCGEFVAKHHAPPVQLAKDFFKALRSHYTGHVNKIFLVAPPRSVGFLWVVFRPFVSERTKNNVVFVTRPDQLSEFYEASQAKPWMLAGGMLKEDLDVEDYIERPFDTAYT
jgi:hypothetical protein